MENTTDSPRALSASDLFGLRVIAPSAPKYSRHGYSGRGYIGVVTEETDTHAVVRFGNSGTRRFHKSHLSALKPNDLAHSRKGRECGPDNTQD
jgi:hypothetical protein